MLVALAFVAWAQRQPLFSSIDAPLQDRLTRAFAEAPMPDRADGVVVVDIDEASLAQLGPWPWPRPVLAELVSRLRDRGARLQLWDVYLPEAARGDEQLVQAVAGRSDVVFGQVLVMDPQVRSPPRSGVLRPSAHAWPGLPCVESPADTGYFGLAESLAVLTVGHLSATPELDGGLRRVPALICQGGSRHPQLTLAAAELLEPGAPWSVKPGTALFGPHQWLERGSLRWAVDASGTLRIPFRRPHSQWQAISALRLLESGQELPVLKGKVVVVGATALGLADTAATPFHANAPGVSVHAELMTAALDGQWDSEPASPTGVALLVTAVCGAFLMLFGGRPRQPAWMIALGALTLMLPSAIAVLLRAGHTVWPIAAPSAGLFVLLLGLLALQVEASRRQARLLTTHLESFLPRGLAQEIARQHPSSESLGRPAQGVILALRVVGLDRWCAAAESLKALGLVHAVATVAERHGQSQGGTLEQLMGDTLLLSWSETGEGVVAPDVQARQVQRAVLAARALFAELGSLLADAETERHPLGLRMAIEAGPYLLAVAGTASRRRGLLLGPAADVSLALLTFCEELASPLLIGQRAAQAHVRLGAQPMGQFLLPDSAQPQGVYRLEP